MLSPGYAVMHVLVVDDDPEMRLVARVALERGGHAVTVAADSAAAAALLTVPDVILMDLLLGREDGAEVAMRLTARPGWEKVPVVYLTARDDAPTAARLKRAGAADVLTKPFDPLRLADAVAAALRR